MKKFFYAMLGLMALVACTQAPEKKVMARFVPERADDFVFENNLIAGRFYGQALEGNPTSPGLDIWVKLPGKLVADEWYKGFLEEGLLQGRRLPGRRCIDSADRRTAPLPRHELPELRHRGGNA